MDDGEGGGLRLGKKSSDKGGGEVDYKSKAGTAWSHSYLNQKPWHPLSYPNQRRKWIAEQTHANRERRAEEVAREFAQEQEFFRQTALFTEKEKEKVEIMKAVSFMYVRPPGYNAESAKAAEVSDERRMLDQNNAGQDPTTSAPATDTKSDNNRSGRDKKARPKDVFGRPLPTEEEFEALKNAPRLETGMPARVKPFGIEIRNVRCVRCGTFGHQSGDRECPLKDVIMPNEESRLKRDDPLTAIMAQTDFSEPLKWELKQKPGMSPPRGGFDPDDPNQQIVAEEIFDEYGGFLSGGDIPALISNFSTKKSKKHSKHKSKHKHHSASETQNEPKDRHRDQSPSSSDSEDYMERKRRAKGKHKENKKYHSESSSSDGFDINRHRKFSPSSDSEDGRRRKRRVGSKNKSYHSSSDSENHRERRHVNIKHTDKKRRRLESSRSYRSEDSDSEVDRERKRLLNSRHDERKRDYLESSKSGRRDSELHRNRYSSNSEVDRERNKRAKGKHKEKNRHSDSADYDRHRRWKGH